MVFSELRNYSEEPEDTYCWSVAVILVFFSSLSQANLLAGLRAVDFWSAAMHCSKTLLKRAAFLELVQCEVELVLVVDSEYEKFIPLSSELPSGM